MSKMDLSGKLSLYDFLTMLVCGFMILALFVPLPSEEHQWIILIILSYLIGLVYHRMLEFIRDVIRERFCYKKPNRTNIKTYIKKSLCFKFKTIFCSNYSRAILKAFIDSKSNDVVEEQEYTVEIDDNNHNKSIYNCKIRTINKKKDKYYQAYYAIMDKPCYSNIKLLEAQEAFLRNFTWIVVVYTIAILRCNCCNYCICSIAKQCLLPYLNNCLHIFIASLFIVAIFVARYYTQMKIYKLVWYGYKYTHNKE